MKLSNIRDMVAVAELGGLRRASRQLGVAQPALSRSIRELEVELGVTLFERGSTGMMPTPAGQAFARRAAAVQIDLDRARDEVRQLHGENVGHVTIGLSTAAHVALLPRVLQSFLHRYPHVRLKISEGSFPALDPAIRDGSIDFYVGPLAEERLGGGYVVEKLFDNHRVVLCRRGHGLARSSTLRELASANWVATSVTVNSASELAPLFEEHGLPAPIVAIQTQNALSMITVAASTDLLTVLPQQWLEIAPVRKLLMHIRLETLLASPAICIVRRSSSLLTPVAQHLCDLFVRAGLNHADQKTAALRRRSTLSHSPQDHC